MLEKNFDGRHFWIKSHDGKVLIDSMFFPCTSEEVITKSEGKVNVQKQYVYFPTIIICNPNALFYHHMVNAPNAFWLNFFIKKGINVMAWNYRGYGHTKGAPTPYNVKLDGESILHFLVKDLHMIGKVGVYGRSLGGVVATHIAAKFPDKIQFLFADRTFGNLESISKRKFLG